MLSTTPAQVPVKESVPFSTTELEREKCDQDKLLSHHLGPQAGPYSSSALHTDLAKSCLQHVYMM